MTDLLFFPLPGAIAGVALLIITIIKTTFGALSVLDGWYMHRRDGENLDTFAWNLGWFLLFTGGGLYLILSVAILRQNHPTDAWVTVFILIGLVWALRAFRSWGRGKVNEGTA